MAATMGWYEVNGATYTPGSGGTNKAAGTVAFRANDSSATDSANPVVRPAAGTQQSYEKWMHLRASGTFTSISNPKIYLTGAAIASGVTVYVRTIQTNTFSAPAVPANNASGTDATSYTASAPKAINSVAAGPWTSAGDVGDFVVLWGSVASTAAAGSMGSWTYVLAWDEV